MAAKRTSPNRPTTRRTASKPPTRTPKQTPPPPPIDPNWMPEHAAPTLDRRRLADLLPAMLKLCRDAALGSTTVKPLADRLAAELHAVKRGIDAVVERAERPVGVKPLTGWTEPPTAAVRQTPRSPGEIAAAGLLREHGIIHAAWRLLDDLAAGKAAPDAPARLAALAGEIRHIVGVTDPAALDAIRRCLPDFDGRNFAAVESYLLNAGFSREADRAMDDDALRQVFATGQKRLITTLGRAETSTNSVAGFNPAGDELQATDFRIRHNIPPDRLDKARRDGRLTGTKRGGRWYYPVADVKRLYPQDFDDDATD